MTKDISLVDPHIHVTVREGLAASGLRLRDSPEEVSALVTQDRDVDPGIIEAAGAKLEALFLLEPGTAKIAATGDPLHSIGNPALLGVAEHTVM